MTHELEVNTLQLFLLPEVGRNMRVSRAKRVESSCFVWDNITRSWDNAVPTRSRYLPEGWGRAVVGHSRGGTFVKIFENEVMIWRTL